jgi:biotin operon repressor
VTPDRFFALMLLLESRDGATTQELASALGVSLRTINRDLNWLRDAGLPVTAHRGRLGGVTMLPGSGLDLTRLTPDERDHLSLIGLDEKQRPRPDQEHLVDHRRSSRFSEAAPERGRGDQAVDAVVGHGGQYLGGVAQAQLDRPALPVSVAVQAGRRRQWLPVTAHRPPVWAEQ